MSTTTDTTTTTDTEAILAALSAASAEDQAALVGGLVRHTDVTSADLAEAWSVADNTEAMLATKAGTDTVRVWMAKGTLAEAAARLTGHTKGTKAVSRKAAHEALSSILGDACPSSATIGRYLRAIKSHELNGRNVVAVTAEALAEAEDMMGRATGPRDNQALSIIAWCEANAGVETTGTRTVTKAEAEATKAKSDAEREAKAEAEAKATKAKAEAVAEAAKAKGKSARFGLVTAKALAEASDESIVETIAACQAVMAEREAEAAKAKAEADAKAKAEADAAKAAEADATKAAKAEAEAIIAAAKAEAEALVAAAKANA